MLNFYYVYSRRFIDWFERVRYIYCVNIFKFEYLFGNKFRKRNFFFKNLKIKILGINICIRIGGMIMSRFKFIFLN